MLGVVDERALRRERIASCPCRAGAAAAGGVGGDVGQAALASACEDVDRVAGRMVGQHKDRVAAAFAFIRMREDGGCPYQQAEGAGKDGDESNQVSHGASFRTWIRCPERLEPADDWRMKRRHQTNTIGRLNQKRVSPDRDSTPTRPPVDSTNCFTIARPMPAPPRARSRDLST